MDEANERMARVDAALARQLSRAMAENARLRATLVMGGYTLSDGAAEWKPPLGPSASPLLDTIDRLRAALENIVNLGNVRSPDEGVASAMIDYARAALNQS